MFELQCIVVTPDRTVCDVTGDYVVCTLDDGEIGIAPRHTPLVGRLACGELRISDDGRITHRYYVEGGFLEVSEDVVTVLTSRAIPADELDPEVIAEQLADARRRRAQTPETIAARDRAVGIGRAQARVARRAVADR
jgi:F-type H+-transporting ATPase subunit epsilon